MNIDIKLAPFSILNTDRNFQDIDDIGYFISDISFYSIGDTYYLELKDFYILYKNEEYKYKNKTYAFIGSDIAIELDDFDFNMKNNFVSFFIKNSKLFIDYNINEFEMDNRVLLGVFDSKSGWRKLC